MAPDRGLMSFLLFLLLPASFGLLRYPHGFFWDKVRLGCPRIRLYQDSCRCRISSRRKYILNLHPPFHHCWVVLGLVVPSLALPPTGVSRDNPSMTATAIIPFFACRLPLCSADCQAGGMRMQLDLTVDKEQHLQVGKSCRPLQFQVTANHLDDRDLPPYGRTPFRVPSTFHVVPHTAQAFRHPSMGL